MHVLDWSRKHSNLTRKRPSVASTCFRWCSVFCRCTCFVVGHCYFVRSIVYKIYDCDCVHIFSGIIHSVCMFIVYVLLTWF